MATPLAYYQQLIDALTDWPSVSVISRRIQEWPAKIYGGEGADSFNALMAQLSDEQREAVAALVQQSHENGVFQTLSYLNDEMNLAGLRLVRDGVELAVEPYGTELYWDWLARKDGAAWPDHQLDPQYRPASE
ncbi:MAG TPA: DUF6547 family protein [Herpetosiphonaceae bacterium]